MIPGKSDRWLLVLLKIKGCDLLEMVDVRDIFCHLEMPPVRAAGFASLALPFADDSGKVQALQVTSQFRMNLGTNSACSQSISQEMKCRQLSASFCCQLPMRFYDRLRLRGIIAGEDVS